MENNNNTKYHSKYYTSGEAIDERLLQGYYDDLVNQGFSGSKEDFLKFITNLFKDLKTLDRLGSGDSEALSIEDWLEGTTNENPAYTNRLLTILKYLLGKLNTLKGTLQSSYGSNQDGKWYFTTTGTQNGLQPSEDWGLEFDKRDFNIQDSLDIEKGLHISIKAISDEFINSLDDPNDKVPITEEPSPKVADGDMTDFINSLN